MSFAQRLLPFPNRAMRRNSLETEFLPEALEIIETPPSPTGRLIAAMIIAIFILALAWGCLGQIDLVTSANGRIISAGKSKVVQPFETGVVRSINVKDGQSVKAGEILVELDRTFTDAETEHFNSDLAAAHLDIARLHAALSGDADPMQTFNPPVGANANMVAAQRERLRSQVEEQKAKIAEATRQLEQKRAERDTVQAAIAKLEATIPIMTDRAAVHKELYDHKTGSKLAYLENLEPLVEQQQDLSLQRSRLQEAEAAIATAANAQSEISAQYRRELTTELAVAEQKAAGLTFDVAKASERSRLQTLTAPVDGTVQQLAIHTIGGIVTSAQQLMVIAPSNDEIEIEADVGNRDIGFVDVGDEAEIKVGAFDFTRFGFLHARVTSLSHDTLMELRRGEENFDRSTATVEGDAGSLNAEAKYSALLAVDRTKMIIDGREVTLEPGMAVTVEFKTGKRSLISYLLSPLFRYRHDSLREM